jgi:hypothetical protein
MCEMAESTKETMRSVRQLLLVAGILIIGYTCIQTLRFTVGVLNLIFVCAWLVVPFLAIRPLLHLRRQPRIWGLILLTPLLLLSSFLLLGKIVFDGLLGGTERTQLLQTFQQGSCTVEFDRYENGGTVGVRGLYLEQRRLIVPGLYVVRSVDFLDYANEGTLSVEGPYRVRVHAKGNYDNNDYEVDKVYSLKPWVYF